MHLDHFVASLVKVPRKGSSRVNRILGPEDGKLGTPPD